MRILFLTQWFQPESHFKGLPFAKELVKRGHQVEVLTGFPNYPGGKVYPGYKIKLWDREVMDGITVNRVALYPSHDQSALRRMANYLSFALSASILGPFLISKADVTYVYHPPATVGIAAIFLKLLRGIPYVYDIQDLWPEAMQLSGMFKNRIGIRFIEIYCNIIYKYAKKIIVLSPGFKRKLLERGVPEDKIEIIYNWCDEESLKPADYNESLADELGLKGRFNILFAGNMGTAQALDAVLGAAEILKESYPAVQFVFIGGGVEVPRLKEKASELHNVLFLSKRPINEMPPIFALADVLLVHLKNEPLYESWIPSKTQAYLYAGKPIIMGVKGDAAELVRKAGAGITCEPENLESIADAVITMFKTPKQKLDEMGRNGRGIYMEELALEVAARRFESIFKSNHAILH